VSTTSANGFGTAVWTDYTINSNEHVRITASGVIGNTVFGTFNNTGYIAEIL
jgi:glutamate synthase domain-containing protein 3